MGPDQVTPQDPELETPQETSGDAQEQQPEPRYVTEDALERMMERWTENTVRRINQSSRDRAKQIDTEIANLKKRMDAANVTITPEQEKALRKQIEDQADEPPQQQDDSQDQLVQQVYNETMEIFQIEEIEVKQTDPEWKIIAKALGDPDGTLPKYRSQLYRAINAKRARLAESEEGADARTLGEGTLTDSNDIRNITDPEVLIRMGEQRLRKQYRR